MPRNTKTAEPAEDTDDYTVPASEVPQQVHGNGAQDGDDGHDPSSDQAPRSKPEKRNAKTSPDPNDAILALVAGEVVKSDKITPQHGPPTVAQLAAFLRECPEEELEEANVKLCALFETRATWEGLPDLNLVAQVLAKKNHFLILQPTQVQEKWEINKSRTGSKNPIAPLIRAWWRTRPYKVVPNTRTSGRIIPAKLAQANPSTDSRAGGIFSLAANSPDGQSVLPGFEVPIIGPALPLQLYDIGNGPSSRSRSAPLALRMFIEALLAVPQEHRGTGSPVSYEVSLRDFLNWFWPDRKPTPSEYWPALMTASEALDRCYVPLINPETGRSQLRRIVLVGAIPRGANSLEDGVQVIVNLPRDSQNGPQLPDSLRQWGNRSAPAYRALINLSFNWYKPGRSHYPAGRRRSDGKTFWAQSRDPERFPSFTDRQIIELCYPTSQNLNPRVLLKRARDTINLLAEEGELTIVNDRIVPPNCRIVP